MMFNTKLHNFAANVKICTKYLKFCNNYKILLKTKGIQTTYKI